MLNDEYKGYFKKNEKMVLYAPNVYLDFHYVFQIFFGPFMSLVF